jgi:nitrite reductase/ring-hydroxylating ferredoxin subunit
MTPIDESSCQTCPSRREFLDRVSASLLASALLPLTEISPLDAAAQSPSERAYDIPAADGAFIDKRTQVILVRTGQRIIAFNLACPHENTALKWRDGDKRFQCPKHESKYTPEGVFTSGRATRNMDRLAIRRMGNQVIVGLDRLYRSDQSPGEWAAAVVQL